MKDLINNFKVLFDALLCPIIYSSAEGVIRDANNFALKILKLDPKKYIGSNLCEHCRKNKFSLGDLFNLQNLPKNSNLLETYVLEEETLCAISWKKIKLSNLPDNNLNKDDFLVIGQNMTSEQAVIDNYKDSVSFYENILSKLPTNVYWKDEDGIYMGCNDRLAHNMGLGSRQAIKGMTDFDFDWGDKAAKSFIRFDKKVMQTGEALTTEDMFKEADGKVVTVLTNKTPLKNKKGKTVGVLAISVDITERKEMEKELHQAKIAAEAANQAKSEFIANMSHDIRTPLTGILGLTQEIIDVADEAQLSLNQPNHEITHMIETVQEDGQYLIGAADELLQLLNEILETMRLESGKVSEEPESFNLYELIEHNIELMQPVARHKKLTLSYEIEPSIPFYFSGLRNYLDRTILNLLSNALKFTDKGFVKINVQLEGDSSSQLGETAELQITVEDSGAGIPNEKFETIFEHFSRLTPSYQGLYKGTGLGLYTVKRYIEAMQATINITSEVGVGTRFVINLPLVVSDHSDREKQPFRLPKKDHMKVQQPKTSLKPQEIAQTNAKAFVLIVEDNRGAAIAVKACLSHSNCASDHAENGSMALKMVQNNVYDLVLMDIGLPDIDGIEVTRQIRAFNTAYTSEVPIIALTGHANEPEKKEEALAAGMQAVFSKPLTSATLETLLKQYVFHRKEDELVPDQKLESPEKDNKVIDWEASVNAMNGDEDCVRELLFMLFQDLKLSQATLAKAYASHDNEALRKELHRVRGGVVYVRLPNLDRALAQFHEAVKEKPQNPQQLATTYSQLQEAMEAFWKTWEKKAF